jgi:hypothetical protein
LGTVAAIALANVMAFKVALFVFLYRGHQLKAESAKFDLAKDLIFGFSD